MLTFKCALFKQLFIFKVLLILEELLKYSLILKLYSYEIISISNSSKNKHVTLMYKHLRINSYAFTFKILHLFVFTTL